MSFRVAVVLAVVGCLALGAQCRTVVLQDNEVKPDQEGIPKVYVGADGVSASFGGYSASAGLGGQLGGSSGASGGLYARAGTPGGKEASAGLGGSLTPGGAADGGLHAGASAGSSSSSSDNQNHQTVINQKIRPGSTLYNDIFNIPTSILGAVNRLLNTGASAVANIGSSHGHVVVTGAAEGGTKSVVGAHAKVGVTAGTDNGVRTSSTFFNDIFNIPITALNAVNQLLNNRNGK